MATYRKQFPCAQQSACHRELEFLPDTKSARHRERSEASLFDPCVLSPVAPQAKPVILSAVKDPSLFLGPCHPLITGRLCSGGALDPRFASAFSAPYVVSRSKIRSTTP